MANKYFEMAVVGAALANFFDQSVYTYIWTKHHSRFLLCWESTYPETGAKKVPQELLLLLVLAVQTVKGGVLRTKFLEL